VLHVDSKLASGTLARMASWQTMAAANNAEWCDLICRTHGAQTRFDENAWTSRTRTPPGYPDAVTLVPDLAVPDLLTRVDTSVGCSIKDSFTSLDLATSASGAVGQSKSRNEGSLRHG